jgi:hypothetical protein
MRNKIKKRSSDRTFGILLFILITVGAGYLYANTGPALYTNTNASLYANAYKQ